MKNLIVAIKKLFAKLGAENIEGNNLVDIIDKGADALANAGGGSEPFVVTFSPAGKVYVADKTYSEIDAAATSGKVVIFLYDGKFNIAIKMSNTQTTAYYTVGFGTNLGPNNNQFTQLSTFTALVTQENQVILQHGYQYFE